MKTRQLITVLVLALVLCGLGALLSHKRRQSWRAESVSISASVMPSFPCNEIEKFTVTDKEGCVDVAKKDGSWRVVQRYDYPADFGDVSTFLRDLAELKATQTVDVGESQYGRLSLLPPGAEGDKEQMSTEVKFLDKSDKVLATVRLGKEHKRQSDQADSMGMGGGGWPDGRYLLLPDTKKVVLVSKTFTSVVTKPKEWLDKEFFKISDMKTAKLEENGNVVYEVQREKKGEDMKLLGLAEGEEKDDSKVRSISNAFSYASFEDVADPKLAAEETGMNAPKLFKVTDFEGFSYTVKIGKKTTDEKYYIAVGMEYNGSTEREKKENETPEEKQKADDEFKKKQDENKKKAEETQQRVANWIYVVTKYTVDDVVKERQDLIKKKEEKKDEAKPAAATPEAKPADTPPPPPPPPPADPAKEGAKAADTPNPPAAADAKATADKAVEAVQQKAEAGEKGLVKKLDELQKGTDKPAGIQAEPQAK